ncbi:MAG: class I SAM-dependent methyltransferase [Anaerolineae bacterium]
MTHGSPQSTSPAGQLGLQAEFFDEKPPLYPWPRLLRRAGLSRLVKPREAMWKRGFDSLNLRPGAQVLDVGCGTGIWLDRLKVAYDIRGFGLDVSPRSIREAKTSSSDTHAFLLGDASQIPFDDASFDAVISLDVLEHVADQDSCLAEMARVLKPGGRLLLWTLNRNQKYTWNWWLERFGIEVYERSAHDPTLLPDVSSVRSQMEEAGISIERLDLFNSFFSLALDEAIMITVSAFQNLDLFERRGRRFEAAGRAFLSITDLTSRVIFGLLIWLEQPWVSRGLSNGFMVLGRRAAPQRAGDGADAWSGISRNLEQAVGRPAIRSQNAAVVLDPEPRGNGRDYFDGE